ncbi:MAG: class I SAM-dependent methyltransferase [Planctomycetes bacterium]|nr:class I SAM-dependent methyltransferase [Planctomycetota bacterium]
MRIFGSFGEAVFLAVAIALGVLPFQPQRMLAEDSIGAVSESDATAQEPRTYMGRPIARTMSYHGADWLTRDSREQEENPQRLIDTLQVKQGQQVCDFGCGNGYYSLRLAPLVGAKGRVFAVDIQQEMLDLLDQRCKARGVLNVVPILAATDAPNFGDIQLDLVIMVDVYHELSHPGEILEAIYKKLSPTGRIALVEYREEDPEVPIRPRHKMSQSQALKEFVANRLKLVGQFDELPWQHVLFFARQDSPLTNVQLKLWEPAISGE